ncbi:MAG: aspartate 1-decarboxylase [Cellulomonas sp. 73-145]|uniref:aspartate 1-decarboxylase n=1 Tax=Cellulomonas sp. 73-145 TaxID=1895739 RepID=UPI000927A980|nr:aspartate 1-decarboxylase [Cellulomonas sp. 73-145]OJV60174.1 MAG: aspartate 1-decarboxylase [Cellulomonas sp. 73-145]
MSTLQRPMMLSKLHRATVTQADLEYVGSITVDEELMEAADLLPNQQVDVLDITNGARLTTYAIPGPRGGRDIQINGAAAHLVEVGDRVIIVAYGSMSDEDAHRHVPRVVVLDEHNAIVPTVAARV